MSATSDSEESSINGPLDAQGDDGWQDLEPDVEEQQIVCLFCPVKQDDVSAFLSHCQQTHNFDFLSVRNKFDLDFIGTLKLVNFLRSHNLSDALILGEGPLESLEFQHDRYLIPILPDDALLFNLEELPGKAFVVDGNLDSGAPQADARSQVRGLQDQFDRLKMEFTEYRSRVDQSFNKSLNEADDLLHSHSKKNGSQEPSSNDGGLPKKAHESEEYEAGYFDSYSYNPIHATMLKDTVRTDAYRDFIYENKNLFAGKIVLDVGCGTGILSMFAARGGAKQVFAVDNSSILEKAQENILENGLQNTIKCMRGKIEDIHLPVSQVDIIISEWMGYCLLFEAMLDSVLWARDHYLASDGLMVPSHASLRIAPFADDDLVASHLDFWKDVYGFSMTSMLKTAVEDVLIQTVSPDASISDFSVFLPLNLRTCSISDLTFTGVPFSSTIATKSPPSPTTLLAGFIVAFDIYFLASSTVAPPTFTATGSLRPARNYVSFTTGPEGPPTHWQQGILLLKEPREVKVGAVLRGTVGYEKRKGEARGLDVRVRWRVEDAGDEDERVDGVEDIKKGQRDVGKKREREQVWSL